MSDGQPDVIPPERSYSLIGASIVGASTITSPGTLDVHEGLVTAVGQRAPQGRIVDLTGSWVVPGFIDMHVHGGGGYSFNSSDPAEIDSAAEFHLKHGTTRLLASLVSESLSNTKLAIRAIAASRAYQDGRIIGVHLEGPFLSTARPGCHDLRHLLAPDASIAEALFSEVPDIVKTMTIAPELPGMPEVIEVANAHGVRLGIGHSAATFAQARDAFRHGARIVTHTHQAMGAIVNREPGIAGAGFGDARVTLELILDNVHNHPAVSSLTFASGAGRVALITDAAPAAGMPVGTLSHVGSAPVVVRDDGRITRRDSDVLAGSALTMDGAFRNALTLGQSVLDTVRATATTAARALGLENEIGALEAGKKADFVVLGPNFTIIAVVVAGRPVADPRGLFAGVKTVQHERITVVT